MTNWRIAKRRYHWVERLPWWLAMFIVAYWSRSWPWQIAWMLRAKPRYIAYDQRMTKASIRRGQKLAAERGWLTASGVPPR